MRTSSAIAVPLILCALGCGGFSGPAGADDVGGDDSGDDTPDAGGDDTGGDDAGQTCTEPPTCSAWNVVSRCGIETPCPGGCFAGECRADACADECALGESGPLGTCRLWDLDAGAFVAANPAGSLVDRARDYTRRQRRYNLPEGGVVEAIFTDPALSTVADYGGNVDSALWTGTLLAAESWRHLATRSPDSAARVAAIAHTIHVLFNVSTSPGYLARYAQVEGSTVPIEMDCARVVIHCDADFAGETYRWRGDTSRDQYTGVMLGYLFAYLATPDPAVKADIRADVLELMEQLMIERQDVPVRVTINGLPIDTTLDSKYIILAPEEMTDGRVTMEVDTGDLGGGELDGAREFVPDVGPLLAQLIGFAPPIPRPGSAMMLGAFYQIALVVTDGIPELATRRAAIQADYLAMFDQLATLAASAGPGNACGAKYYGFHIDYIMAYAWSVLEQDPARRDRLRADVMANMWDHVDDHDNVYFALLDAASRGIPGTSAQAIDHLGQYPAGPRVHVGHDHTGEYPHDPDCTDGGHPMSSVAVAVGDRAVSDFIWQRHPWRLVDGAALTSVLPAVDFVAPYWLARYHGLAEDDRIGTCTRWD